MEIRKFTTSAGFRMAESGLRIADSKLRTVKENVKDGLTSSVIGAEDDTADDKEVEQHLSASERTAYRRMPEWKKRRLKESAVKDTAGSKKENIWNTRVQSELVQGKQAVRSAATAKKPTGVWSPAGGKYAAGAGKAAAGKAGDAAAKAGAAAAKGAAKGVAAAAGVAAAGATAGVSAGLTAVKAAGVVAERTAQKVKEALAASMEQDKAAAKGVRMKEIMDTVRPKRGGEEEGQKKRSGGMGCLTVVLALFAVTGAMVCLPILCIILLAGNPQPEHPAGSQIVEVARAELSVSDANVGGYRYKDWYGMDADWCAMFVSYCSDQCGYLEDGIMPKTASVATMLSWYRQRSRFNSKESGYEPGPGDVVFFGNGMSHVGLVVDYDTERKTLTTIEGNTGSSGTSPYHKGSRVKEKKYPITYRYIVGYGTPDYPEDEEMQEQGTEPVMGETP